MTSLVLIGECMMELNATDTLNFKRAYAGDTYNTAVYAKRWQPSLSVAYLSAVGTDNLSDEMLSQWKAEGLNTQYVLKSADAQLGIYAISKNNQGVRSVAYWRKDSAATQIMQLLKQNGGAESLPKFDYVYFTGISLGILSDEDKQALLDLIAHMKKNGTVVAFDPNYRAKIWSSREEAKKWATLAYQLTDIALPGLTDHKTLFDQVDHAEIKQFVSELGCKEIVIKSPENGIYAYDEQQNEYYLEVPKDSPCIDTTAAGDSFAGTYLAARIAGDSIAESIQAGADVASSVVKHIGAITH